MLDVVDTWIVCNKSCDHVSAPQGAGGCLRVDLTVCFLCQVTGNLIDLTRSSRF